MKREEIFGGYRIAYIDLDDTLLGPDKQVSPENLAALDRLREAGVEIAIASGRHHKNIVKLNAIEGGGWIVSSNGASICHEPAGQVLLERTMDPELIETIRTRAYAAGLSVIAYHRDGAFIERETAWTEIYAQKAGWVPSRIEFRDLEPSGFHKVLWSEEPDFVARLAPALKQEFAGRLNVLVTNPELIEFFAPTADKSTGAKALAEHLGIARNQTLAFGDGSNDVELMEWAGFSVAMHHGNPLARAAARHVSPAGMPESAFARAVETALRCESAQLAA